ncbi:MAG: hypothetical protein QOI62_3534 [Solirubrobacteraceae bacterium]|jgi:glucose/arabinose dehydrogenase|nr:hypothetical protein [Solirubrobacteraceae bacterium]
MRRLVLLTCLLALAPATAHAATVTLAQIGAFTAPVYVTAPPGDVDRLFVVQQGGTIVVVNNGLATTFADLTDRVLSGGERGLLSMAFAPDYATSGLFYVYYTAKSPTGQITIEEHRVDPASPGRADPSYARVLATIPHDQQGNHNGGQLQFGPDGLLYAGTGDGGSGGDPAGNGQNLGSSDPPVVNAVNHNALLGKLLRLDPRAGTGPSIFAYGLRNPWRFSFDRLTGDLVVADVGQSAYEEVDFAPAPGLGAGANYGWNRFEGAHTYPGGAPAGDGAGTVLPVVEHSHADGWCSITGGYVVRDAALPELAGTYVYSDYCKGRIYGARLPGGPDLDLGLPAVSHPSSFGEDACGRVYVASIDGPVYRLTTTGECVLPAGSPLPATTGADQRAPAVTLRVAARQRALRTGFVAVRVACDEPCAVRASGRVLVARARAAATRPPALRTRPAKASLAPGATRTLRLRLSRATRAQIVRALRRPGRRATVRVTITATDAARNARTDVRRVRIVRR